MRDSSLAVNIAELMEERGIHTTAFSEQSGIPKATLQKIVTGASTKPRPDTIHAIASFFNVPVAKLFEKKTLTSLIPIISWDDAKKWVISDGDNALETQDFFCTTLDVSKKAFAVHSNENLFCLMHGQVTLAFDPNVHPKDGGSVLVQLSEHKDLLFRQLIIDVKQRYIKPINPEFSSRSSPLGEDDKIIATLIEARINYKGLSF